MTELSRVERRVLAGVACDDRGIDDGRTPLVFLHGLTFDRTMWGPALAELERLDPCRRALVFDLPGHGASEVWASYGVESVAEAVHRAVEAGGLESPVLVGHSLSAIVASVYASRYPASGVINVDQSLQTAPFRALLQSLGDQLRGPGFSDLWPHILASMHVDLLPPASQDLVRSSCRPDQDLVLGYWREVLETPAEQIEALMLQGLHELRGKGLPYLFITSTEPDPVYREWLLGVLPQADIDVWPGTGHFPHLARPTDFAGLLDATTTWPAVGTTPT